MNDLPHNKKYRGKARTRFNPRMTDKELVEYKKKVKKIEQTRNESERFQFEQRHSIQDPQLRFDYSDNVFSLRGDWQSRVKVLKIFFPFMVDKKKDKTKIKKFEEEINNAFKKTFLV